MIRKSRFRLLLFSLLLGPALATAATPKLTVAPRVDDFIEECIRQGFTAIRVDGLEVVYVNPKARLNGYTKVILKPVKVEPDTQWRTRYYMATGRSINLRPMIENAIARAQRAVEQQLLRAGYAVAQTPAADVVEVSTSINDVFLMAVRNKVQSDRVESYSLGTATLVAELRDSSSGELILRVFDAERGPSPKLPMNQAGDEAEAWLESAIDGWAEILRKGLDVSNRKRAG